MQGTEYEVVLRQVKKPVEMGSAIGEDVFNTGVRFEKGGMKGYSITEEAVMKELPTELANKVDHIDLDLTQFEGSKGSMLYVDIYYK